jgi:DNA-directed RNA polymerase subunit H (RpoH/RPB5)
MAKINPLLSIKKDSETIRTTVLTNIVKMLYNRKWISAENYPNEINKIINSYNDNQIYIINLDVNLIDVPTYYPIDEGEDRNFNDKFNGKTIAIKLLPQKITSIGKSPIIQEFMNEYKKSHKIIIVDSISEKSKSQITVSKHIEIFEESFFMINLMDIVCCPKYEILTPDETLTFLESYHLTRKQMNKMYDSDPMSQYLFLKKKQIVRIIRDSEITGQAVNYRLVIHKGNA